MKTKNTFKSEPYWLLHHGRLLEWTTEPIKGRIAYIRKEKPALEIPVRLKWMKPVKRPDLLPRQVRKARAACDATRAEYRTAWEAYDAAWTVHSAPGEDYTATGAIYHAAGTVYYAAGAVYRTAETAYQEALVTNWAALVAQHKKEYPGCPFDYAGTGELIFARGIAPASGVRPSGPPGGQPGWPPA